jgi:hypothetical protein
MSIEKPRRRMTLQELLVAVDKHAHTFEEYMHDSVFAVLSDVREMSRPRRRHSPFPTYVALQNSMIGLREMTEEVARMTEAITEWFSQLDEHVQRAKGIH